MPRPPRPFALASAPPAATDRRRLLQAAKRALEQKDYQRAQQLLAAPLRVQADDPAMLGLAALAHRGLGDLIGALSLFERALNLAPDLVAVRLPYAETLIDAHRPQQALDMLDALPASARDERQAVLARANALGKLGDQAGEVAELRRLAGLDPRHAATNLRLGHALRSLGEVDDAIAHYRAIIADHPHNGAAWWSLANSKSVRFSDDDRRTMREALAGSDLGDTERIRIGFALGRAEELAGHHEESFRLYAGANALRHKSSKHDPDKFDKRIAAATALFTPDFFAAREGHGFPSDAPIFIVGMQRSGSTLVEQMLSSHPLIEGTAELPYINQLVRETHHRARLAGLTLEQQIAALTTGETRRLGEDYIERAAAHRQSDRPIFLDKMPNNWAHIGFIRLILPRARVIDARRHPMACGFSNFRQLYATGLEHCYSLDDWGRYYGAYVGFMAHFDAVQPGWIKRMIYERLVDDPEGELRRLTDHLGIPFDPAMLEFHRNERTVRTISAQQVRRPLHRKAVDEWQGFAPWLDPLRAALCPVLETWDAPQEGTA